MVCECGCGQAVERARFPSKQVRFRPGHHMRQHRQTHAVEDRGYTTPCWIWQGKLSEGYAYLRRDGGRYRAHRWYWEQANGPVPEGLQLDHLCQQKDCVNPEHLEAVTQKENMRRRPVTKLTFEVAQEIAERYRSGERQRPLAAEFGVTQTTVSKIARGVRWTVDDEQGAKGL